MTDRAIDTSDQIVPAGFPRSVHMGALPGSQPKLSVVLHDEKFFSPGCMPPEIRERWLISSDLAQQLVSKARESEAGKRSHMSKPASLEKYLEGFAALRRPSASADMRGAGLDWMAAYAVVALCIVAASPMS